MNKSNKSYSGVIVNLNTMNILQSNKPGPTDPQLKRTFRGPRGAITACEIDPTQRYLLCGSEDSSLTLYSFNPSQKAISLKGHTNSITDAQFSPTGTYFVSSSIDKTIRYWQGSTSIQLKHHSSAVRSVDFSCDGQLLVSSSDDLTVKIWSAGERKVVKTFLGHENWVRDARFSPDARFVVSGGNDKGMKMWDTETGRLLGDFPKLGSTIRMLRFSPDGNCIAVGDSKLRIWDARSKLVLQTHDISVNSIAFHPSSNYLFTAGGDGSVKIWDLRQSGCLYTLYAHKNSAVTSISCSLDGNYFVSGGRDCQSHVWKTSDRPGFGEITLESDRIFESARIGSEKESGLPRDVTDAVDKLVDQLEIVTNTLMVLEQRVSKFEDHVNFLEENTRV